MRSQATIVLALALTGCTFNFELTSQRTALENQVMGSYKELEDDLVLVSSVRGPNDPVAAVPPGKKKALDARQNQDFNRDDIDELKDKQVLGETVDGTVVVLPKGIGNVAAAAPKDEKLAVLLVTEENRDRAEIWRRIIDGNANLSTKDLPEVRRTYAKMQRESAGSGHWYQDESGRWQQKPAG